MPWSLKTLRQFARTFLHQFISWLFTFASAEALFSAVANRIMAKPTAETDPPRKSGRTRCPRVGPSQIIEYTWDPATDCKTFKRISSLNGQSSPSTLRLSNRGNATPKGAKGLKGLKGSKGLKGPKGEMKKAPGKNSSSVRKAIGSSEKRPKRQNTRARGKVLPAAPTEIATGTMSIVDGQKEGEVTKTAPLTEVSMELSNVEVTSEKRQVTSRKRALSVEDGTRRRRRGGNALPTQTTLEKFRQTEEERAELEELYKNSPSLVNEEVAFNSPDVTLSMSRFGQRQVKLKGRRNARNRPGTPIDARSASAVRSLMASHSSPHSSNITLKPPPRRINTQHNPTTATVTVTATTATATTATATIPSPGVTDTFRTQDLEKTENTWVDETQSPTADCTPHSRSHSKGPGSLSKGPGCQLVSGEGEACLVDGSLSSVDVLRAAPSNDSLHLPQHVEQLPFQAVENSLLQNDVSLAVEDSVDSSHLNDSYVANELIRDDMYTGEEMCDEEGKMVFKRADENDTVRFAKLAKIEERKASGEVRKVLEAGCMEVKKGCRMGGTTNSQDTWLTLFVQQGRARVHMEKKKGFENAVEVGVAGCVAIKPCKVYDVEAIGEEDLHFIFHRVWLS